MFVRSTAGFIPAIMMAPSDADISAGKLPTGPSAVVSSSSEHADPSTPVAQRLAATTAQTVSYPELKTMLEKRLVTVGSRGVSLASAELQDAMVAKSMAYVLEGLSHASKIDGVAAAEIVEHARVIVSAAHARVMSKILGDGTSSHVVTTPSMIKYLEKISIFDFLKFTYGADSEADLLHKIAADVIRLEALYKGKDRATIPTLIDQTVSSFLRARHRTSDDRPWGLQIRVFLKGLRSIFST